MILVAYRHGLRVSELITLKWQQIGIAPEFPRNFRFSSAIEDSSVLQNEIHFL